MTFWRALAVLASTAAADVAWTYYIRAVAERSRVRAAAWNGLITLLAGVFISQLQASGWYLVPAAVGAVVGTLIATEDAP